MDPNISETTRFSFLSTFLCLNPVLHAYNVTKVIIGVPAVVWCFSVVCVVVVVGVVVVGGVVVVVVVVVVDVVDDDIVDYDDELEE